MGVRRFSPEVALSRLRAAKCRGTKKYRKTEKGVEYLQHRNFLNRFKLHGMTLDQYHSLAERQDFLCACCGEEPARSFECRVDGFHIDHDHKTGMVRALLCYACNGGLGLSAILRIGSNWPSII